MLTVEILMNIVLTFFNEPNKNLKAWTFIQALKP